MKKIILFGALTILAFSLFANPWGHRYPTEQSWQDTTIDKGTTLTFSVEWGEGDWTHSDLGYGTSTDGTGWTWVDIPWFEDGSGSNKRCKTTVTFNTAGTFYYAYRMDKNSTISYQHGSDSWSENASTLSATSYVIVQEPPTAVVLSSFTAAYLDGKPYLNWITQSESDNQGWNIYRNETAEIDGALQINPHLIAGAGTTSEPTEYQFSDYYPVDSYHEYYYWIEEVNVSGLTSHYGPISLMIPAHDGNNPAPPLNENAAGYIYNFPNPAHTNSTIHFMAREVGLAEVSIYNIKGQKIKTVFKGDITGENLNKVQSVYWNGTDDNNEEVSDGIYLNVLKINGKVFTHNMIIMK